MENTDKSQVTNFFLKLFDTNVEDNSIPSLNFTSIIHMHSTDFQKICRDMNMLGEKMEITSSGSNLIFRCMGDFAEQETVIADNQASMKVQTKGTTNEITKCTTLCPSIELYLKNDYPLILRYMVANLGEVKLVLAPIKNKPTA
jgi:proliferating cell nuclear antigen